MATFNVEVTDTFGGEANYSWVKRFTISAPTERGAIMKAKREAGFKARHTKDDFGDTIRLQLVGVCVVFFLTPKEVDDGPVLSELQAAR